MADVPICIRIPAEWRAQIEVICASTGVTISEFLRSAAAFAMNHGVGIDEGYMAGRAIGLQMAHVALEQASQALPETYEGAMALLGNQ